ncbi:indole-3-glycerol phosphate synthase TrpC [Liquorilactobacillus capillatus]|uniref:Indole-3-glycerol phosphate synthase n=1 Tax=Liquorilactobacillus capillatus DSM 19910 TaxID=1423731 RepID=A0A0R1M9U4_9LACO|nr:indole-3-glycerol phosphate synthase TrpC [Liquorilactobacillus capillatus]KRL01826.1 hypothetical protein FC81_GL001037 [Liquorilactobacillus capillatus DSM 19910]
MILEELVTATRQNMYKRQQTYSCDVLKKQVAALDIKKDFLFEKDLATANLSIIAEVKKASPSKGVIVKKFPYLQIAHDYTEAGVAAISVLTEQNYFQGNLKYLRDIAAATTVPVLRKDFIIDPYMIYEAKINGASIILLIVAILTDQQLKDFFHLANDLGMSAIVEVHSELEVQRALAAGVRIIGINNRNLKDFSVSITTTIQLRKIIPTNILLISESGIRSSNDVAKLKKAGLNGILVGEYLMHSADKKKTITQLSEAKI